MDRLSVKPIIRDGLLIGAIFSIFVLLSLKLNPWLWFEDYPPSVKALVIERPAVPIWQKFIAVVVGFGSVVTALVASTHRTAKLRAGFSGFFITWLHAFFLVQMVNLIDVLFVDWLIFATIQPTFMILPGTEGAAGYSEFAIHFRESFLSVKAWLVMAVISFGVAILSFCIKHIGSRNRK